MNQFKPTDAEMNVLRVLWDHGPSTVRFVNETLSRGKKVGYTTTLKIMQIMLDKKLLTRESREKKHVYSAAAGEKEVQAIMLDKLLDSAFGGSASQLVLRALGNHSTSREELEMIRELIDKLEERK